ncbi:hypothetical protein [Gimesia fumaroli]|uniref:Uncharacterized protein n=1 Tax=Gimesia fumaroli TaxID=2527976 RepID=A0A518I947_9PLAN|nr:hypothetical protein [Gimesia fumaroli]QDV49584.1 hypothetical protein Enr17x_16040 [Gimesia fumaroli]
MSKAAEKPTFEDVIKDGTDFGQWLYEEAKGYWGIEISLADANDLSDEEKAHVFTWVQEAIYADECFLEEFPEFDSVVDSLITPETPSDCPDDKDMEEAMQLGVQAANTKGMQFRDNNFREMFAQERYVAWRTAFVQTRDKAAEEFIEQGDQQDAEPATEEVKPAEPAAPVEPCLTLLQKRMLEIDAELIDLNPRVREAQNLVDSLKDDLKEAKSDLDGLLEEQADLCNKLSVISEGGAYQPKLPFNDEPHPDVEDGKNRPHGTPALATVANELKKQKQEDPAKKAAVHDLGLTETMTDKLVDSGIHFIADLEERIRNANIGKFKWHDGITGVAKGGATKIEDALEAWRRENPVPCEDEDDDDEPVEVEAEATEEEPDTIKMPNQDLEWWCCECDHKWPQDGDNDQCLECENETGNELLGYFDCPDSNELGVVVRNFEEVKIIDQEKIKCLVRVYADIDSGWISSIDIQDEETPYMYSNTLSIEGHASSSRDAAIFNQLSRFIETCDVADSLAGTEIDEHLKGMDKSLDCDFFKCVNCDLMYAFDKDNPEKPHCPHCGAAEHTAIE